MGDRRRKGEKLYYRIGEVAAMVGVEPHVLRYWESEFRITPHRSPSGHRLYRREEIERFIRIQRLLHLEGFTIAGARRALAAGEGGPGADPELLRDLGRRLSRIADRIQALLDEPSPFGLDAAELGEEPDPTAEDDATADELLEGGRADPHRGP